MTLLKKKYPVCTLDSEVAELESSLEKVKALLEEQSPTVPEAQRLLKVSARSRMIPFPDNFYLLNVSFCLRSDGRTEQKALLLRMCGISWMLGTVA